MGCYIQASDIDRSEWSVTHSGNDRAGSKSEGVSTKAVKVTLLL